MLNGYYNRSVIRPVIFKEVQEYDKELYNNLKWQYGDYEIVLVEFNDIGTITNIEVQYGTSLEITL